MTQHIGIVACSAEGAALCYRTICVEGAELLGEHAHPELTMHTYPLSEYMRSITVGDWEGVAALMLASANHLCTVGADFLICPDNTIHGALPHLLERSPLPWLHIAEVVAQEAKRRGFARLGVLGTRYLMEGPVYKETLSAEEIGFAIPPPEERAQIDELIFSELVYGRFEPDTRDAFSASIDRLRSRGCDAVVLGCTEIPLLIDEEYSSLPTLDSTRLLARAALYRAVDG